MTSNKSGFTLLETVVALALASAGLAAIYQVYASAARAEQAASDADTAARLAEPLLRAAGSETRGEVAGFSWELITTDLADYPDLERRALTLTSESGRNFTFILERPVTSGESP